MMSEIKTFVMLFGMFLGFLQNSYSQSTNVLPSTGNVGIGTVNPNTKLQVCGKVVLDSSLVVKDSMVIEKNLKAKQDIKVDGNVFVNGTIFSNEMLVAPRVISPIGQEIALGDSSININYGLNYIYTNGSTNQVPPLNLTARGLAFSSTLPTPSNNPSIAYASGSMTFGSYVYSDPNAVMSFTFGRGVSPTQYLINTKANSFMVSFNSDLPTFFVGPASGTGTTGKVGIGTNNPDAKLEVLSEVTNTYSYAIKAVVSNSLTKAISIIDNSTGSPIENFLVYGNGQVYCREIFVKLGVLGDFVFDENYKLLSFEELTNYIKENKHLPGVPAENAVLSTGLNVGEMVALVLQKTEENTLYILNLNERLVFLEKQNLELEATNAKLQKEIIDLANRIEALELK